MTKALTPQDVREKAGSHIPSEVIDAFNELILENSERSGVQFTARVMQDRVVTRIFEKLPTTNRQEILTKGWLDIELVFERAGWTVVYDKPSYNESYEASFTFTGIALG